MAVRSKRIDLKVSEHLPLVNPDNIKLLDKFIIDMSIRDLAETTQYQYLTNLKQWFVYILLNQNNRSVLELEDDDITQYLYFCKQQGNNTNRMKLRISTISSFYKFLRQKKLMSTNPTEFIEAPKKGTAVLVQTYLTSEQIAMLREKLIECGNLQWRLYFTLSLSTMARVTAIASLKWSQIDFMSRVIHDVLEKEGKIVDLYFNDEVKQLLLKIKQERKEKNQEDYGWLFYSGRCTPEKHISKSTLEEWCKKIGAMIDVPTLHPHDMRHSGANNLRDAGMPLEDISVLLNHESTETTTKFYLKKDTTRINMAKNRLNL